MIKSLKDKRNWLHFVLSAIIFFAIALPFRSLLSLIPGITEIRPANVIPPLLGLIWGPAAAFGISIGNLISDIISGSNLFICVTGFIANFIYAYLPYKLWYSSVVSENDQAPTLGSVRKILKYIYIIMLDSLVVTGILSLIFETAGFSSSADSYGLLFLNNFDFAVLLGVPLLIFLEYFKIHYYSPVATRHNGSKKKSYVFDGLLYLSGIIGLVWLCISLIQKNGAQSSVARVLLCIATILALSILFKPFRFFTTDSNQLRRKVKVTIKTKVTIGFLLIAVIFISFIAFIASNAQSSEDMLSHWTYVYSMVGLAINAIFAVAIVFLWYVERNIVNPLEQLTNNVEEFASRAADSDEIPVPRLTNLKTGDEIALLGDSCNTMMKDISEYMYNLRDVTAEKERIGAELDVATHIQKSMLPCIFPAFPERKEIDIYATMDPAKEVGGDFYDFFMVDDSHLAIVMADVSGKGVPAALFMVIGKTLIKDHTQPGANLGNVFSDVNDLLCESNSEGLFITAFEGVLDFVTGEFNYVNAGHEIPYICKSGENFEPHKISAGFVLAGMEGMKYKAGSITMDIGDKLFQYTDGVTEATDASNVLYGSDRMKAVLDANKAKKPHELLPAVKADIDKFVGEAPQFDDITMLCLEYKERMKTDGRTEN